MPTESQITAMAHVIQLAIAPVFLISGVATLLNVLASRLGRIVDRARYVATKLDAGDPQQRADASSELKRLADRARLVNVSISLCTTCALLICIVIAMLFTGTFMTVNLSKALAVIFIAAMLSLFVALLSFLREILIATRALRIFPFLPGQGSAKPSRPVVEE
jgi:hypothetical protein